MTPALIGAVFIVSQLLAALGNWCYLRLHTHYGYTGKSIMLINLAILAALPVYALLSLTTGWEVFILTSVYGFQVRLSRGGWRSTPVARR